MTEPGTLLAWIRLILSTLRGNLYTISEVSYAALACDISSGENIEDLALREARQA